MRADPRVVRRKFDRELAGLERTRDDLSKLGCFVVRAVFPEIDVLFVPRNPLVITVPVAVSSQLILLERQARVLEAAALAGRAFGVRIGLDDFDIRAPSAVFCDAATWEPLPYERLLRATHAEPGGPAQNVLLDGHPDFKRPFLCMRGLREYHEHLQHSGDDWFLHRGSVSAFSIVMMIWRTCVRNVRPNLNVSTLQILWETRKD